MTNTILRIVAALTIALLTATGCDRQPSEWRDLTITEGGFSVLMRGQAHYLRQPVETPAGRMEAHLYSSDRPDAYFAVGYSDYPLALVVQAPADALLAGVRDTWVKRVNGRIVSTAADPKFGKYPGLQFTVKGTVSGKEALLEGRLYLVDQRLYQVVSLSRTPEISQGVVNRFFSSFRLVDVSGATLQIDADKK